MRPRHSLICWILLLSMALTARPAAAVVQAGDVAPNFTKNLLAPGPATGAPASLSDYAGKVVLLALAGYNCPFCLNNAPSVEANVWQYYQNLFPGQVQVLSADVFNGSPAQLQGFKNSTGVTYPLMLNATTATGGNLYSLYYPDTDDYIVINKQGIVRYHAADLHGHGLRYVLSEIRGCVDSLVSATTGVEDRRITATLDVAPNPFGNSTFVTFAHGSAEPAPARLVVLDLTGRRVARLYEGRVAPGRLRVAWDGRAEDGSPARAGVYFVQAEIGAERLSRRVVRLP